MMWISRKRFEALEAEVWTLREQLRDRTTLLEFDHDHEMYRRLKCTDALRLIQAHLGMEFKHQDSKPETWTASESKKQRSKT
jgi:hypothetical protein